jgi:hypothetical protein
LKEPPRNLQLFAIFFTKIVDYYFFEIIELAFNIFFFAPINGANGSFDFKFSKTLELGGY